tara:strand:+ start:218 stop:331 length:114 start_codon:yes stop_codon:yes gene_type:complete
MPKKKIKQTIKKMVNKPRPKANKPKRGSRTATNKKKR